MGRLSRRGEFGKKAASRDGLRARCKACGNACSAAWRMANPERVRDNNSAWYAANPEKAQASSAAWKEENPEKVQDYSAAWYEANTEKKRASVAAWYEANPERARARNAANPEKVRARKAAWRKANPEACRTYWQNRRARKLEAGGKLSKGLAERLFNAQDGKCACCGEPLTSYHLDHIVPLALGGTNTDDNIQLLLPRCNRSKGAKHPDEYMMHKAQIYIQKKNNNN